MPKWRNGRRSRLKICRGQLHAGSTPAFGTKRKNCASAVFFVNLNWESNTKRNSIATDYHFEMKEQYVKI